MIEHRAIGEVRAMDGRVIEGTAIAYGDVADIGGGRKERFLPGAFAGNSDDVLLLVQHDRGRAIARTGAGLVLQDSPQSLRVRAELPSIADAENAYAAVRAGILRGLSIGFSNAVDSVDSGVRTISSAVLHEVSIVDSPAYPESSVEARRQRRPYRASSQWRADVEAACSCATRECDSVRFTKQAIKGLEGATVPLYFQNYQRPLGTAAIFQDGVVKGEFDASSDAGRVALQAAEVSENLIVRPFPDENGSRWTIEAVEGRKVQVFQTLLVRAAILAATDPIAAKGWERALVAPVRASSNRRMLLGAA